MKKEVLKVKKKEVVKKDIIITILNKILMNYFTKDSVDNVDDKMIICPVGTFLNEDDVWIFDIDFTHMTDNVDIINLMSLIKDISVKEIDIMFSPGYHSVYNDDDICCGIICEDDIEDYALDGDISYEEAFEKMSVELIEEYTEEMNEKEIHKKIKMKEIIQ